MQMSKPEGPRVAIIAVHGVADQKPGETARALADLLVTASPAGPAGGSSYRLDASVALGLRVTPLAPSARAQRALPAGARGPDAPLTARLAKAWRQSVGSDLHRQGAAPPRGAKDAPELPHLGDADIELTDFLLAQSVRNEMPDAAFDTERLSLTRSGTGGEEPVHLYEMYWADLSRLAGSMPRIVTELFTLIFRLSQLGRDTVASAARLNQPHVALARKWRGLDLAQAMLDWLFSRVLAQLVLQLGVIAAIIVPLGIAQQTPGFAHKAAQFSSLLLPAALLLWALYRRDRATPLLILVAAVLFWWLPDQRSSWIVALLWLALVGLATDWLLTVCEVRFPMTRLCGRVIGGIALAIVVGSAGWFSPRTVQTVEQAADLTPFILGALRAIEFLLLGVALCWIAIGTLLVVWLVLGYVCAAGSSFAQRSTVATGRLGLFASMALFLTLVMACWALLEPTLLTSVAGLDYTPLVFKPEGRSGVSMVAECFLEERYTHTTEAFAIVVLLMSMIVVYLVVGMLPSVLAELQLFGQEGQPLGRWLSGTFRRLDRVLAVLVSLSVACAGVVTIDLVFSRLGLDPWPGLRQLALAVQHSSQDALGPLTLVLAAASATAALTLLGGLLSRYLPGLRAPLDIALDVDSHFREFPRKGIPRSRIFSRFAVLLRHVLDQGYERVVIVAHSQGTVITAELLRYLRARAAQPGDEGEAARLGRLIEGRVHLLTAGCPLRQLYASRFPALYPWVLHAQTLAGRPSIGPTAQGLGVQRWLNAYCTGDYVGRWLWSRPPRPGKDASATIIDEASAPCDVYTTAHDNAAFMALARRELQLDICLGGGAHTHYFEPDRRLVAGLVDGLVSSPWPPRASTALA